MEPDGFGKIHVGIGISGGPSGLELPRLTLSGMASSDSVESSILHDAFIVGKIAFN